MSPTVESRIESLARRDQLLAVCFTVFMWVVLVFALVVATAVAPTPGITIALVISMLLLGGFNTASILAMVRRHAATRDLVYRPDIDNLDKLRQQRAARRQRP
ncbi:hypothetical protein [Pseudonocardia acaciae]|uniref:hypothetical protein n=1 Tax=Pseudonocardia acaciae TaxID=551276 RepID=UPI0005644885|nr:hypothetical protein [Pseudonocardia acaciae]